MGVETVARATSSTTAAETPAGLACGIDVGGTKIAGGVVDASGRILEELRVESPAQDTHAIEAAIAGLVSELRSRHDITSVGVGAAGYVDRDRATVRLAPNLAWREVDLRGELAEHIDLPIVIENDANAAAWGEFRYGAGEDVDDLMMLTIGTGVGGGIVLGGRLHRGAFGIAAEIGHLRLVPQGNLCGCGQRGCFEQYGSGSALVREARVGAEGSAPRGVGLLKRAGGDVRAITGPIITAAARDGDDFAISLLADLGRWIGEGIASLAAVLDPAVVVIGGGVSEAEELLLDPIRAAFEANLPGRDHRPVADIRRAALGNDAGIIGAADLARQA